MEIFSLNDYPNGELIHNSERRSRTPEITIQLNPVRDILEITISNVDESGFVPFDNARGKLNVINVYGTVIYTSAEKAIRNFSVKIDFSALKPGIYFLRFENGKNTPTVRFIKF